MTLTTFLVAETYFECLVRQEFDPDATIDLGGNSFYVGRVHMILGPHLPLRVADRIREAAKTFTKGLGIYLRHSDDPSFEVNIKDLRARFKDVWAEIRDQFDPLEGV